MPLPSPILDDRSYEQLREELVRRIPVYAPEWTDHNASDPGVALLELFAFLGENLLYRFNQIPESTQLAFLRLLDVPLRPAQSARALVAMAAKDQDILVEQNSEAKAGARGFETRTEVHVWPVSARAITRAAAPPPDDEDARDFAARAIDARGGLAPGEQAVFYTNRTVPPDPMAPDAQAVDVGEAVDGMLWVAVLGGEAVRERMLGGVLNVAFVPDETIVTMAEVDPCPGDEDLLAGREGCPGPTGSARPRREGSSPPTSWQASSAEVDSDGDPVYVGVSVESDTTAGLSRQGIVRLRLPNRHDRLGRFDVSDADLLGTGDLPPDLEDDNLNEQVLFWLRAFREDGGHIGRVLWIGVNAAEVEQVLRAPAEFLGTGDGEADQRYRLVNRRVVAETLTVEVEEPDGWVPWRRVEAFDASGEEDPNYVLDPEAGEVRFGDGVRGRVPQIGQRIRTPGYRYGGGQAGNVPAKAISKLARYPAVTLSNPLPARGGAESERVTDALERVPGELRRRDRAVTAGDFRELALATPGADLGRAETLARFHPRRPGIEAAGVVTVVVWPREDRRRPNAPVPDRSALRSVCRWLDRRRLVTTELYVVPPTYHRVAVSVGLRAKPGYGIEAVRRWVELVLRQYLAPLPPYGPAGNGWPLGRCVYGPELEAAALQVEGVEFLEGLDVADSRPDGTWASGPVELESHEVPELAEITVVEGEPLPPGESPSPPPPETPSVFVPIPTPREEC